ncbi:hypothetical protein [Paraburkholderia sp. RL17-337-BIB-A]|uniref:hypothetical protein n=1 Tax=Paraburkholderia sp. RL17-337-BIB-A TaxID=3031636 RepID=UPI0038BB7C56
MSRFLCLSFFAAAKKVSAAPHRGNTNRPITNQGKAKRSIQGKANPAGKHTIKRREGKQNSKTPTPQASRSKRRTAKKPTINS